MFGKLFSLIGLSWGSGGISVTGPSEPPSFPEYGTLIEVLYNQSVPIASGGGSVEYQSTQYENQRATVQVLADGAGGSFLDWANRYDVVYKNGEQFTSFTNYSSEIVIGDNNYGSGCTYTGDLFHDGSGWYYEGNNSGVCIGFGVYITNGGGGEDTISTPIGNWAYQTWDSVNYYHDGMGGYYEERNYTYTAVAGDYIGTDYTAGNNSREVPDMSGNYFSYEIWDYSTIYYNGSGGYYSTYNYTYNDTYGDYITFDGSNAYYWDGSGGYYY